MLSIVIGPIAWLRGAKLVNWLQDIFPEVALQLGVGRGRITRVGYALMRLLRDHSLRRATMNVAIGERMAQRLSGLGVPDDRIRVIANWADGLLIQPINPTDNALRQEWGLQNAFVIGYSGNLGRAHDYRAILDAIGHLAHEADRFSWLFVGGGAQFQSFRREVETRNLSTVRFQPYQPRELLAQSLSVPDVHLVTLRPSLEGLIVPSKFYGVAAVGRPTLFIGDPDGEIARNLREHKCGITVPEGDGEELTRTIRYLADNPDLCALMGMRARAVFLSDYDKSVTVSRWDALLREIETK